MPPRGLDQLFDSEDPAWPHITEWIAAAKNPVRVLPRDEARAAEVLYFLQVSTHSTLGAIAWETGGILVDDGWLRLLGSASREIPTDLRAWNDRTSPLQLPGVLIVAHDAVGGVFAVNADALPGESGGVWYFAPSTLQWQDLQRGYSAFVEWTFSGDLDRFYRTTRWETWRKDAARLNGDYGFSIHPFLWAAGPPIDRRSRQAIPITELWPLERDLAAQMENGD